MEESACDNEHMVLLSCTESFLLRQKDLCCRVWNGGTKKWKTGKTQELSSDRSDRQLSCTVGRFRVLVELRPSPGWQQTAEHGKLAEWQLTVQTAASLFPAFNSHADRRAANSVLRDEHLAALRLSRCHYKAPDNHNGDPFGRSAIRTSAGIPRVQRLPLFWQ